MKTWLKERLPFPVKLALKRLHASFSSFRHSNAYSWSTETPTLSIDGVIDFQEAQQVANTAASQIGQREIQTSIIIPVFNKAEFTSQCLFSLLPEIDLNTTEVIIVNNASTDQTAELLDYFKESLVVIDNSENKGFVDAGNQAAAIARGKYLVFLNNDTLVLSGWLRSLLDTVEREARIGAVGSLFLYPDGKVQEAGAIIWKTGEALHYGWRQAPEDPRFVFARDVDYCSGASLLIRKDLFEQLGGFDRRFAPAYYEDVDLCMGVRSLGYRVVYQPASRIVHYEGATAGRDLNTGFKNFQLQNREKLYDKWKDVLEREHLANEQRNIERAAHRTPGPAVIVFDDRIPTPDRDAGSARMLMILRALAKHNRTLFVYQRAPVSAEYEQLLWKEGIETAPLIDYPRLLKERKFQTAIVSRPDLANSVLRSIKRRSRETQIIFDMVDAHYLRFKLEHQTTGDEHAGRQAERYRKIELDMVRVSDYIWCNSSDDKLAVQAEVAGKPIAVIPTIHTLQSRGRVVEERANLLFIGNFSHSPNRDAIEFFMKEIFPQIRTALPGVKFDVIGSNAPPEFAAYASAEVAFHGYVPDITPLFHQSRVFVAPLRFGAGVKGKICDSLSYGLPVVTTSVGASGMGFVNGTQALIADGPQEFADAVIRVYRDVDLWQRLSNAGYAHIAAHFTPEVVEKIINDSLATKRS